MCSSQWDNGNKRKAVKTCQCVYILKRRAELLCLVLCIINVIVLPPESVCSFLSKQVQISSVSECVTYQFGCKWIQLFFLMKSLCIQYPFYLSTHLSSDTTNTLTIYQSLGGSDATFNNFSQNGPFKYLRIIVRCHCFSSCCQLCGRTDFDAIWMDFAEQKPALVFVVSLTLNVGACL